MKLKKLIEELDDDWFYLSLYFGKERIYGDFCYTKDTKLKDYLSYEVLDIEPSETAKIIKVILEKVEQKVEKVEEPKLEEKEAPTNNGKKRRNSTSRKSSKVS